MFSADVFREVLINLSADELRKSGGGCKVDLPTFRPGTPIFLCRSTVEVKRTQLRLSLVVGRRFREKGEAAHGSGLQVFDDPSDAGTGKAAAADLSPRKGHL
eukprot:GHVU01184195.1.p2 GENE.GHVU01184195.1~~GHVU01184195.1.p2  ORF type:complete len:102 (-),score=8.76 GHVU01184195.1:937-1242(-)